MTSILIRRPLLEKCTGSLVGKALEASVSINDVTSRNDGRRDNFKWKGGEKEDVIIRW